MILVNHYAIWLPIPKTIFKKRCRVEIIVFLFVLFHRDHFFNFCCLFRQRFSSAYLQFAGQKDGATRCAQIVQQILANHVDHDVSDPLVAVQLNASNACYSVSRQPQFDVLSGKASRTYDDGKVQVGAELPRLRTLDKYWGYFLSMQSNASTMRFSDNQGVTHHLPCSKGG